MSIKNRYDARIKTMSNAVEFDMLKLYCYVHGPAPCMTTHLRNFLLPHFYY